MLQTMKCVKMVERAEVFRTSHLDCGLLEDRNHTFQSSFVWCSGTQYLWDKLTNTIHFLLRNGSWALAIVVTHSLAHT